MRHSEDRILTSHAGSLIRPPEIVDFEMAKQAGASIDEAEYEKTLKQAVEDVVRKQVEIGIDIVDDGEFSKSSWGTYINGRVSGFERQEGRVQPINYRGRDTERFAEFFESPGFFSAQGMPRSSQGQRLTVATDVCVAPITYHDQRIRQDVQNLRHAGEQAGARELFLAVVAPASAAFNAINEYYKSEEAYVYALAEALKQEYEVINSAGIIVQADDAVLANAYDHLMAESPERYRQWAELRIEALNYALSNIPEENVRYHLCYGSWHAPHMADAPLEKIVDLVLRVKAQAFSLEAANVRHEHEWRVWEDVKLPDGKILIPGVVTHHTLSVEHPRLVADRIIRYANIVGRENVIGGTDCGFAQGAATQRVHPSIQWAKLEALVEGARIASQELWNSKGGKTMTNQVVRGSRAGTTVPQPDPPGPGELQQTPREIEGPYFRLGAPERSNLLEPGDKPELVLSGRVLNERGVPIPDAIVQLWSSDAVGNYDMIGYRYHGYQRTDAAGRYEFTTIIPGCYHPRNAKHLHVKVQGNSRPITTQLYVEGEPGNEDDHYYSTELLIKCRVDENGVKHGTFDFVIKQVTEQENVTPESLAARV